MTDIDFKWKYGDCNFDRRCTKLRFDDGGPCSGTRSRLGGDVRPIAALAQEYDKPTARPLYNEFFNPPGLPRNIQTAPSRVAPSDPRAFLASDNITPVGGNDYLEHHNFDFTQGYMQQSGYSWGGGGPGTFPGAAYGPTTMPSLAPTGDQPPVGSVPAIPVDFITKPAVAPALAQA
jgi:hypothetical protein